jgi:hypothetical protein
VKRSRKPTQKAVDAARIQRAVTGMLIPMTSITKVYSAAEKLIADGADDVQLVNGIRMFLNSSEPTLHVGRR